MFYFTCNESRIYKSLNFEKLQTKNDKKNFHDIQFFLDARVCVCVYIYIYIYIYI